MLFFLHSTGIRGRGKSRPTLFLALEEHDSSESESFGHEFPKVAAP